MAQVYINTRHGNDEQEARQEASRASLGRAHTVYVIRYQGEYCTATSRVQARMVIEDGEYVNGKRYSEW